MTNPALAAKKERKRTGRFNVSIRIILDWLSDGIVPEDIFDFVGEENEGFKRVAILNKWTYYNVQNNTLLSWNWFDYSTDFWGGEAQVQMDGHLFTIDTLGKLKRINKQTSSVQENMKTGKIKISESQLRNIITKTIKQILKEDRQRLPFASLLEYANEEMPSGFKLEYNNNTHKVAIKQENVGLSDISNNGLMSGYFEALAEAFKVMEKYTMGGTGFEGIWIQPIGEWKGHMSLDVDKKFNTYFTDAYFEGYIDNNSDIWTSNPYDDTNYHEGMKYPYPEYYDAMFQMDKDSEIDNRPSTKKAEKQINRADNEQLHSMDSLNRELMDMDMLQKIKGKNKNN